MRRTSVPEEGVMVATTSGIVRIHGKVYRYIQGQTRVRPDHVLVRTMPKAFRPDTLSFEAPPEMPAS